MKARVRWALACVIVAVGLRFLHTHMMAGGMIGYSRWDLLFLAAIAGFVLIIFISRP